MICHFKLAFKTYISVYSFYTNQTLLYLPLPYIFPFPNKYSILLYFTIIIIIILSSNVSLFEK